MPVPKPFALARTPIADAQGNLTLPWVLYFAGLQPGSGIHANVQDLGATADGITDDTAAVAATIKAVIALGGGNVYFPPGTYLLRPVSFALLPMADNLEISGMNATLKIADNAGSFDSIFGARGQTLSNVFIHDLTIDMNSTNNPVPSTADLSSHPRAVAIFGNPTGTVPTGANCRFQNVVVTDIRSTWAIRSGAVNTSIVNCSFTGIGGGTVQGDSSILYLDGDNPVIVGNQIIASAIGANLAITAIETHCSNEIVIGNTISNMQLGGNITGISPATNLGHVINGNVISGCFQGLDIWSYSVLGATNFGFTDASISNNVIVINQLSYSALETLGAQPFGINLNGDSTLPFARLKVSGNLVKFDLSTSTSEPFNTACIGIGYIDLLGTNRCDDSDFSGNTVINAPLCAYRFTAAGDNISFDNNVAINPGSHLNPGVAASFRVGILYGAGWAANRNFSVKGGSYIDDLATSRMCYGILDGRTGAWQAATAYTLDFSIIDPQGHLQLATTAGMSGSSIPTFNHAGGTTSDGSVVWTDSGFVGLPMGAIIDGPTVSTTDPTSASLAGAVYINAYSQPYVRSTVNVPAADARATLYTYMPGSSVQSMQEAIHYAWNGVRWDWSAPHDTALTTADITGGGTGVSINGTDRYFVIVVGSGTTGPVKVTFKTPFTTQPLPLLAPMAGPITWSLGSVTTTDVTFSGPGIASQIFTWGPVPKDWN